MLALYKAELKKIFFKKSTAFLFLSIILLSFLYVTIPVAVLDDVNQGFDNNWKVAMKQNINERIEHNESIINEYGQDLPISESFTLEQNYMQIEKMSYHLNHNIEPPPKLNVMENLIGLPTFDLIIAIMSIFIAGKIIPKEISTGTINLLLIRPYKRIEVLLSKYFASLTLTSLFIITLYIFTLVLSLIFTEINPTTKLVLSSGDGFIQINFWGYFTGLITSSLFYLILVTTVAFSIGAIFLSSTISLGASILLLVIGTPIVKYLAGKSDLTKYLLMSNWELYDYLPGRSPILNHMTLEFSIFVCLIYLVIFLYISFYTFNKRDFG